MARRVITVVAFLLWGLLSFLTLFVLFTSGPDVLVLISLIVLTILGAGIFGALGEKQRPGGRL